MLRHIQVGFILYLEEKCRAFTGRDIGVQGSRKMLRNIKVHTVDRRKRQSALEDSRISVA